MHALQILLFICSHCICKVLCYQCACATGDVNIRTGPGLSHHKLDILQNGDCLPYKGHIRYSDDRNDGRQWVNVDYNSGTNAWVVRSYLTIKQCTDPTPCPTIVQRNGWLASAPITPHHNMSHTPTFVVIHDSETAPCFTKAECSVRVNEYQHQQMTSHGLTDIRYNFLVGEDGNVYEGRGWGAIGAHTFGYNDVSIGICLFGDFSSHLPNDAALNALKALMECGVNERKLSSSYTLQGHRDMVTGSDCPGDDLYNLIKTWQHYH